MRGYCTRCQEFRSDVGEDAWSIIWNRHDNPRCERCGGFVDTGYFVAIRNKNCKKPQNSSRKHGDSRLLRGFIKSGFSRNENERKKRRIEKGRENKADKCVRKKKQK